MLKFPIKDLRGGPVRLDGVWEARLTPRRARDVPSLSGSARLLLAANVCSYTCSISSGAPVIMWHPYIFLTEILFLNENDLSILYFDRP